MHKFIIINRFSVDSHPILVWIIIFYCSFRGSYFVKSDYSINYVINEELPIAYHIGNVVTDSKFNQSLLQSIFKSNTSKFTLYTDDDLTGNYFSVDSRTGDLLQSRRLDREKVCHNADKCIFKVVIYLITNIWFKVTIFVKDINDNSPLFVNSRMSLSIRESEIPFFQLPLKPAIDSDLGDYSVQKYLLFGLKKVFSINYKPSTPSVLSLILISEIDYDRPSTRQFSAKLIACDGGNPSKCGEQLISIRVLDVNDNKPQFAKKSDSLRLSENTPVNQKIYCANATDLDSGLFGKLGFSFSSSTRAYFLGFFRINSSSGDIFVRKKINIIDSAFITLYIVARDEANKGPNTDEMTLKIYIQSENKHYPEISIRSTPYKAASKLFVKENSPIGTYIGTLLIEDKDKFENGQIDCQLDNGVSAQKNAIDKIVIQLSNKVNQKTFYSIKTVGSLDCEDTSFIDVSVKCTDFGANPKSAAIKFNISVVDINELAPHFASSNYSATVTENSPPGVRVLRVNAQDRDCSANLSYHLSDSGGLFHIDAASGALYTYQPIDREVVGSTTAVDIIAIDEKDGLRFSCRTTVAITIGDVNDNIPSLLNQTHMFVLENFSYPDGKIGQFYSHDPDLKENGTVEYEIIYVIEHGILSNTFNNSLFYIDQRTGLLLVAPGFQFDFELARKYEMKIQIRDLGIPQLTNEYDITVEVLDVNDNAPVWLSSLAPNNRMSVNVTNNFVSNDNYLVKLVAVDYDGKANTNLTYQFLELSSYDKDKFRLLLSGELFINSPLSPGVYELKVISSDNGCPPLFSEPLRLSVNVAHSVGYSDRRQISISVAMLTVAVFLVSGLVLTVLLGVGYLWRRWSCPGCHGNCHFHCCYGNPHISSCRRLLLQLGWWQRRSNPPDNADCHGKKRVDKPTSPNNSTNRTIIHDDRDDIDDDKLSSGQSDKLMMMLQQQQHHKQEHQNQQQSSRSSVSPLASQMMLDVCHSNTPGIDLDVNIGLVNSMMLKQMMLTNPSSLSTQTPLQAPTLLYTNQSGVLEIECSSTDSGRGASDENQQLSLMIPDKSAALLSQMSPQFCCYTLLPTSSSCSTDPRNQPSYMQHPLLVSAAALESPPHSSPSPILAYPPTSFPDLYHTLLPSTNSDQYPSSSLQSYLNSLSQHHYNKPHQHLPELLPIISSDLLSPSNSNEEAMTTATMATDSVQTTDSCSNNECSHCLQHQMLTNTSTNLSYSDTSLLFHHYK